MKKEKTTAAKKNLKEEGGVAVFITKTDKAIGMIVDQTGTKKVGVILTREVNDRPMCIDYFSPQWLAENTTNFDKYNSEYVFNILVEHAKTIGASKEALAKLMLFAPDNVKKELKKNAEAIYNLYDAYMSKLILKKKNTRGAKVEKPVKEQVKKENTTRKRNELFTLEEIEGIKATEKDTQLLGKNKSDTARRIVIKYHDTKTDDEMLAIARKIWVESNVQNNLIKWHHRELIDKGIIKDK